ncbi:MAG: acetate kinase [Acidimicrobiaceae bacterium]
MTDAVLVVNAGSSSLKLSIIAADNVTTISATTIESWDGEEVDTVASFIQGHRIDAVGHRVVHGGVLFTEPVVVDDASREAIASLTSLAPLHQPRALAGIDAARQALPDVPAVACFDTAFHASLPSAASTYAVPAMWREQWGVRRFGFHGLSHRWASRRAAELLHRPLASLAIVTCHLGAGASLCAVDGGRSVDTTMGFTPLEGLVMATRSGTVDPGLVLWLLRNGLSIDEVNRGLEHEGGLLALAGTGDMRALLAARAAGDQAATGAFDVYVHRLCREVAGMTAALGRLDALVFTGGVGEHAPEVRAAVAERVAYLGVSIDTTANQGADTDGVISEPDASLATVVVTAREDLEIADQVRHALTTR